MIVIPAIDLKQGKCVRLLQGRMESETIYGDDPVAVARRWEAEGAERLHVVDLEGAVLGRPAQRSLIEEMVRSVEIPLEVGGGIRDLETIEAYLAAGVRWVVLGTAALDHPSLIVEAARRFPGRMILGVDAKGGKVAVQGWQRVAAREAGEFAKAFEETPLSAVIFTDIARDGTEAGVNWEMTRAFARFVSIPVIASGGVSGISDIRRLREMEADGVIGVIVGKALYSGRLDLKEALAVARGEAGLEAGAFCSE